MKTTHRFSRLPRPAFVDETVCETRSENVKFVRNIIERCEVGNAVHYPRVCTVQRGNLPVLRPSGTRIPCSSVNDGHFISARRFRRQRIAKDNRLGPEDVEQSRSGHPPIHAARRVFYRQVQTDRERPHEAVQRQQIHGLRAFENVGSPRVAIDVSFPHGCFSVRCT